MVDLSFIPLPPSFIPDLDNCKLKKLTKEQAIVITGFTGVNACKSFSDFHGDVEKRLGRPVFTHEFGDKEFSKLIEELYKSDFMDMVS